MSQPRNVVLRFYKSLENKKKTILLRDIVYTIILLTNQNEVFKASLLFSLENKEELDKDSVHSILDGLTGVALKLI